MTHPSDKFWKFKQYPTASFQQVQQALQKLGYQLLSDNSEIALFRRDVNNSEERPVTVQILDEIPPLTLFMIADNNNIDHRKLSGILWEIINRNN